MTSHLLFYLGISTLLCTVCASSDTYLVGLGKGDITGPVADINLMGYANPSQIAGGIHIRLYARAFIVADPKDPDNRVVFVNLDACMASQAVTFTLLSRLKDRYGPDLYTEQNVILSGTHTHSGPAGYLQYIIYDITGLGFVPQTFNALVDGIERAIVNAHETLAPGHLSLSTSEILDANINRSPTAYLENPIEEREMYQYNVDKEMTSLLFTDATDSISQYNRHAENDDEIDANTIDTLRGIFSWFPVHGTSMNNTNSLVNGDNKGAASQFLERFIQEKKKQQQRKNNNSMNNNKMNNNKNKNNKMNNNSDTRFIGAFCQANVGDTSPNTQGAYCIDTGLPCDAVHSTCNGKVQKCIGRGPGWPNHFDSTRIIALKQASAAYNNSVILNKKNIQTDNDDDDNNDDDDDNNNDDDHIVKEKSSTQFSGNPITGPIQYRHVYLDMRNISISASKHTRRGRTCVPAMGFAFAAGTTDGPGAFDFTQSDTNGTAFWRLVRDFITKPSPLQIECHSPKPILLDVGDMHYPYEWIPSIVEIQIVRIGYFVIAAVPGEFTTMAGRRLKRALEDVVKNEWASDTGNLHIVIAGLSNTYASYITTYEEYQAQRYEGGFTLYGPHTLDAYIQEFKKLAGKMIAGITKVSKKNDKEKEKEEPVPPNLLSKQWSLVPGVVADGTPLGRKFGDVSKDVEKKVFYPGEKVVVEFHSACPRNNLRTENTYLTVERKVERKEERKEEKKDHHHLRNTWICTVVHRLIVRAFTFLYPSLLNHGHYYYSVHSEQGSPKGTTLLATSISNNTSNDDEWEVILTDSDWETTFEWKRHASLSTYSYATITWNIPNNNDDNDIHGMMMMKMSNVRTGVYRIRHFGDYKHFLGHIRPFTGSSSEFRVEVERKKRTNVRGLKIFNA